VLDDGLESSRLNSEGRDLNRTATPADSCCSLAALPDAKCIRTAMELRSPTEIFVTSVSESPNCKACDRRMGSGAHRNASAPFTIGLNPARRCGGANPEIEP
jgi:hypothetical protein